jgi:hypothetical protein
MKWEIVEYDVVDGKMDANSGKVILTDFANLMEVHEYMDVNFEPLGKHWMARVKKEPVDLGDFAGPLAQARENWMKANPGKPLPTKGGVVEHKSEQTPEEVEAYWTKERMAEAKPIPMPTPK